MMLPRISPSIADDPLWNLAAFWGSDCPCCEDTRALALAHRSLNSVLSFRKRSDGELARADTAVPDWATTGTSLVRMRSKPNGDVLVMSGRDWRVSQFGHWILTHHDRTGGLQYVYELGPRATSGGRFDATDWNRTSDMDVAENGDVYLIGPGERRGPVAVAVGGSTYYNVASYQKVAGGILSAEYFLTEYTAPGLVAENIILFSLAVRPDGNVVMSTYSAWEENYPLPAVHPPRLWVRCYSGSTEIWRTSIDSHIDPTALATYMQYGNEITCLSDNSMISPHNSTLLKHDVNGAYQWTYAGASIYDSISATCADDEDNVYVLGLSNANGNFIEKINGDTGSMMWSYNSVGADDFVLGTGSGAYSAAYISPRAICWRDGFLYTTQGRADSSQWKTYKLDASDGSLVWAKSHTGDFTYSLCSIRPGRRPVFTADI